MGFVYDSNIQKLKGKLMIAIIDNNNMFIFYKEMMQLAKSQGLDIIFITFSKNKHHYFLKNGLKSVYLKEYSDKNISKIEFTDLEKRFSEFTINQCIENDRILKDISKEKAEKILQNYFIGFNNFLERHDIEIVIGEVTWGVEYLFYHLAAYKDIVYINPLNTFAMSKIRLVFFDKYNSNKYFFEKKDGISIETKKLIDNRKDVDVNQSLGKKLNNFSLNKYIDKIKFYFLYKDKYDYRYSIIMKFRRIQIMIRRIIVKTFKNFIYDGLDEETNFYYYPLHVQPEATPDIVAINYNNQLEIISQIARSLPFGTKLVVKEHPNASGNETLKRLLWIKNKNNVLLVSPKMDSKSLIRSSLGVITIAGTVGIEARLENKPVLLFSNVYYASVLDHIYKITNYNEISGLLKSFISNKGNYECTKCEDFFKYIDAHSFDCYIYDPLVDPMVIDSKNINSVLNAIKAFKASYYLKWN